MLADLNTRNASSNRLEFSAKLYRGIGLHIESIYMGRAAGQPYIYNRSFAIRRIERGLCISTKEIRLSQSAECCSSQMKKFPPVETVAQAILVVWHHFLALSGGTVLQMKDSAGNSNASSILNLSLV